MEEQGEASGQARLTSLRFGSASEIFFHDLPSWSRTAACSSASSSAVHFRVGVFPRDVGVGTPTPEPGFIAPEAEADEPPGVGVSATGCRVSAAGLVGAGEAATGPSSMAIT